MTQPLVRQFGLFINQTENAIFTSDYILSLSKYHFADLLIKRAYLKFMYSGVQIYPNASLRAILDFKRLKSSAKNSEVFCNVSKVWRSSLPQRSWFVCCSSIWRPTILDLILLGCSFKIDNSSKSTVTEKVYVYLFTCTPMYI